MCQILIVDNHDLYRSLLRTALDRATSSEVTITEAKTGTEAIEMTSDTGTNLIFLDMTLPGTREVKYLKKMKKSFPTAKIIVLIDYDVEEYREAAYKHGADHVLVKTAFCLRKIRMAVRSIPSCNQHPNIGVTCHALGSSQQHSTDCLPRLP